MKNDLSITNFSSINCIKNIHLLCEGEKKKSSRTNSKSPPKLISSPIKKSPPKLNNRTNITKEAGTIEGVSNEENINNKKDEKINVNSTGEPNTTGFWGSIIKPLVQSS